MIKHEEKKDMTITFSNVKTAYAYEGHVKLIFHNGAWIKSKKLTHSPNRKLNNMKTIV